jgi:hypothetical protein
MKKSFERITPKSRSDFRKWLAKIRLKRITETVELAAQGIRANHYADLKRIKK